MVAARDCAADINGLAWACPCLTTELLWDDRGDERRLATYVFLVNDLVHCHHCGDVIGVYEPLVTLADGHPRETSRALELDAPDRHTDGACYHRACFERVGAEGLTSDSRP